MKINIKDIDEQALTDFLKQQGEPAYRLNQILAALYLKKAVAWDDLTTLPTSLRKLLAEQFDLASLTHSTTRTSEDGSAKLLFLTKDNAPIEAVYMPQDDATSPRKTLCISTMTGCPLGCVFCATGSLKKARSLTPAEILDQIFLTERLLDIKLTNIVFMGMGEPMLDYDTVSKTLSVLCHEEYQMFSKRKITLSTVGIKYAIRRLAESEHPVKLAISLHATTNGTRSKLIPANNQHDLKALLADAEYYYKKTRLPITYEYILFDGINDTDNDIKRLIKIGRRVPSKINLIPMNDISFLDKKEKNIIISSSVEKMWKILEELKSNGIHATIRKSYGSDIEAACGQLAANPLNITIMSKN